MRQSGIDALGMHLEAVTEEMRARVMPGKAQVSVERYFEAFAAAVPVFGRGQVSTYILAGLGDSKAAILATCERLIALGVYPFVVPFVPISGTPLESHPPPSAGFMHDILGPLRACCAPAACRRPTSRRAVANAAHVRRSRPMSGRPSHDLRAVSRIPAVGIPRQIRDRAVGAPRCCGVAPARLLRRAEDLSGDDRDATDDVAIPIVALSSFAVVSQEVVGTVRIHRAEPGVWWGSRLAVAGAYRRVSALGTSLIRLAVSSAHARGCKCFYAHVQAQNAPLFHRLGWTTLDEKFLHGHPHHFMQADLGRYPPIADAEVGFLSLPKAA